MITCQQKGSLETRQKEDEDIPFLLLLSAGSDLPLQYCLVFKQIPVQQLRRMVKFHSIAS
jgi:hypothetical protein